MTNFLFLLVFIILVVKRCWISGVAVDLVLLLCSFQLFHSCLIFWFCPWLDLFCLVQVSAFVAGCRCVSASFSCASCSSICSSHSIMTDMPKAADASEPRNIQMMGAHTRTQSYTQLTRPILALAQAALRNSLVSCLSHRAIPLATRQERKTECLFVSPA